ncbi:MAG: ATP-binding protein [Myxococcales bacterium]|nr:ATP-binding protein [Myxococcales bacterium]
MQGLVLDATSPLYGRAQEILKLEPLGLRSLAEAFHAARPMEAIDRWAVWGGVPRYWELALDYRTQRSAVRALVLDPQGPLHREPERLILDELEAATRAASILSLIGQGCHRLAEIGARLGQPATSLSRPLARLVELGFVVRETPFGASHRDVKRSFYRLAEPLLRFCYTFVEPNRSRLAAGQLSQVEAELRAAWPRYLGGIWEDLARGSVAQMRIAGVRFGPASRWWGKGLDGLELELDLVAERDGRVLVGEVKSKLGASEIPRRLEELRRKAERFPLLAGRQLTLRLWALDGPNLAEVVSARDVLESAADQ